MGAGARWAVGPSTALLAGIAVGSGTTTTLAWSAGGATGPCAGRRWGCTTAPRLTFGAGLAFESADARTDALESDVRGIRLNARYGLAAEETMSMRYLYDDAGFDGTRKEDRHDVYLGWTRPFAVTRGDAALRVGRCCFWTTRSSRWARTRI